MAEMHSRPVSPLDPEAPVTIEDALEWTALRAAWIKQLGVDPGPGSSHKVQLCRCQRSQLRFFWPMSLAATPSFYAHLQGFPWYYQTSKWDYAHALEQLPRAGTLLDIGCGAGHFLKLAGERGLDPTGLELNESAVSSARSAGFNVTLGTVEQAAAGAPGTFDVVTAFQVLEHVDDPRAFLAAAVRLLRPNGLLVIAVPDSDGWIDCAGGVLECPPHHVTHWSGMALQFLTRIFPLVLERREIESMSKAQIPDFARSIVDPAPRLADLSRQSSLPHRVAARMLASFLRKTKAHARLRGTSQMAVFQRHQ